MENQSCLSIVRFISLPLPHEGIVWIEVDVRRWEKEKAARPSSTPSHGPSPPPPLAYVQYVHTSAPVLQVGTLGTRFFFFSPPKDYADWVVLRFCSQSTPELGICEVFLAQRCIMYVQYFTPPDGCCMYRCYTNEHSSEFKAAILVSFFVVQIQHELHKYI